MQRRFALFAFGKYPGLVLFALFFLGAEVLASRAPTMRVLVKQANELRIRSDGTLPLTLQGHHSGRERVPALRIRQENGGVKLFLDGREDNEIFLPKDVELRINSRDSRGIWLGKRRYRGELRIFFRDREFKVINYLDIEDYLASVVGSEMPKDWPFEALKAQAVAARTYALQKVDKRKLYDVNATENNQVYLGIESETKSTTNAVKQTKSLVITYQGRLINAVFHSTSGGFTESSGDVWRQQLPYLVAVVDHDQHSPKHQWEITFDQSELGQAFPEAGLFKGMDLTSISQTGRVLEVIIKGQKKDLFLTGKELRKRLGLKSTLIRFKIVESDQSAINTYNPFSSLALKGKSPSKAMRRSKGFWRDWSIGGESILDIRLPIMSPPPPVLANNSFMSYDIPDLPPLPGKIKEPVLFVRGFGAGHGVGLSQWGANGLAQDGFGFKKILKYYYSGVAVRPYW